MLERDEHDIAIVVDVRGQVVCDIVSFGGGFAVAEVEGICLGKVVDFKIGAGRCLP